MGGSRTSSLEPGELCFVDCPQFLSHTLHMVAVSYIRNLRTRHAVATRDPSNASEGRAENGIRSNPHPIESSGTSGAGPSGHCH